MWIFIFVLLGIIFCCSLWNVENFISLNDIVIPYKAYNTDNMPLNLYSTEYDVNFFKNLLEKKKIQYSYKLNGIPLIINSKKFQNDLFQTIGNYLLMIFNEFKISNMKINEIIYYYKNIKSPYNHQFTNKISSPPDEWSDLYCVKSQYTIYRENKAWGVSILLNTAHKISDIKKILLLSYEIKGYVFQDKLSSLNTDNPFKNKMINPNDNYSIISKDSEIEKELLCMRKKNYKKYFGIDYDVDFDCSI